MIQTDEKSMGDRIRERRQSLGLTQEELARRAGTTQTTIEKIENGKSLRSRYLPSVYTVLDWPLDELANESVKTHDKRPVYVARTDLVRGRDFPVYASVEAGQGSFIVDSDPVDWVGRPAPLEHVKDGYGLIVTGDSMEPVFRQGDVALVHPRLPPRIDEAVVLYTANRDRATIKEYRGATEKLWKLRRYSPKQEDFTVPKAEWPICHSVVGRFTRR